MSLSIPFKSLIVAAASVWASAAQAQPAESQALRVKSLAATCAQCHGTAGHTVDDADVPGLVGLQASYIVAQMKAFRSGTRTATVMQQLAKGFSEAQVEQIAAYFAAQPR